jgi:Domain of unknown function (DUF5658)
MSLNLDEPRQKAVGGWQRTVSPETVLLLLICLADTAHTLFVVRTGIAHEANPLIAWCLDHSNGMFVAFKMGITSMILATVELLRPRCDNFVRTCLQLGVIGYALLYSGCSVALALR